MQATSGAVLGAARLAVATRAVVCGAKSYTAPRKIAQPSPESATHEAWNRESPTGTPYALPTDMRALAVGTDSAPARTSRAVARLCGVTKTYRVGDQEVHALRGVSLELYAGELVVLLGPSGSGKSTLLNILGALDSPTAGAAFYLDHDLTNQDEALLTQYRREHVGFVFQFYNLIPSLTARENVALVTDIATHPMTPEGALALVGLAHRLDHFPSQLSGGEQQRVAIARAIAKRPNLLLCDEPTGALDVTTGIVVLEALERVTRELGTTTALITHNAAIGRMADRVILLTDGRIARVDVNATRVAPGTLSW